MKITALFISEILAWSVFFETIWEFWSV